MKLMGTYGTQGKPVIPMFLLVGTRGVKTCLEKEFHEGYFNPPPKRHDNWTFLGATLKELPPEIPILMTFKVFFLN